MKQIMSLVLALALTAALLTGCGCAANVSTHPGGMITEETTRPTVMPHPTATHETTRPTESRPHATMPTVTGSDPTDGTTATTRPAGGNNGNAQTGEGFGLMLCAVLLVVSAAGIFLVVRYGHSKKLLCLVLCMAVLLPIIPAQALANQGTISVDKQITVGDKQYTITTTVTYPLNGETGTTYTATFTETWASTQTKDVQDIAALNHKWGSVEYTFAEDGP